MRDIVAMLGWLTHIFNSGMCFMSVCQMKSNYYSSTYSSLGITLINLAKSENFVFFQIRVKTRIGRVKFGLEHDEKKNILFIKA